MYCYFSCTRHPMGSITETDHMSNSSHVAVGGSIFMHSKPPLWALMLDFMIAYILVIIMAL